MKFWNSAFVVVAVGSTLATLQATPVPSAETKNRLPSENRPPLSSKSFQQTAFVTDLESGEILASDPPVLSSSKKSTAASKKATAVKKAKVAQQIKKKEAEVLSDLEQIKKEEEAALRRAERMEKLKKKATAHLATLDKTLMAVTGILDQHPAVRKAVDEPTISAKASTAQSKPQYRRRRVKVRGMPSRVKVAPKQASSSQAEPGFSFRNAYSTIRSPYVNSQDPLEQFLSEQPGVS